MGGIIVYGSHYGTTQRYAQELARRTGMKAFDYRQVKDIDGKDTIVYMGGLYAGGVVGLKKMLPKLQKANKLVLVTVGVADPKREQNIQHIRKSVAKQLGENLAKKADIVCLRGGIDYGKLKLLHRIMMWMLYSQIKKKPSEQLSEEDKELISTYGKKVDFTNLEKVAEIEMLL